MVTTRRGVLFSLLIPLTAAMPATAQISWATSLDDALAQAEAKKTIVMISFTQPGERGSDITHAHYEIDAIQGLSEHSINLNYTVTPGGVPGRDESAIRERFLSVDDPIPVPAHLFVKPGGPGELISSVAFQITAGQLEWIWADAIRRHDANFAWELGPAARAPERMLYGEAEAGIEMPMPPTEEEVEYALDEMKKSRVGGRGRRGGGVAAAFLGALEHVTVIVRSDEKDALKWAEANLRNYGSRIASRVLRVIGDYSPQAWAGITADFLEDRDDSAREEAARALEQLVEKKSARGIEKQLRREENATVKGRLIRALAACSPADKRASKAVGKAIAKDRDEDVRMHAAIAAGVLEIPTDVADHLEVALGDESDKVRTAAAYAVAARRDPALLPLLESAKATEKNPDVRHWIETAIGVVGGGAISPFKPFVEETVGDRLDRQPLDVEDALRRAGGGRGRGGTDGDGDGDGDGG